MITRVLATALAAGCIVGLLISVFHAYKVTPLIYAAETYETGGQAPHSHAGQSHGAQSHAGSDGAAHEAGAEEAWAPEDGAERVFYTVMANVLTAVGYALLLVGAYTFAGRAVGYRRGMVWGLCGFIAFALAPASLLPPEVPGAAAADLLLRQVLWVAVAVSTALGIALFAFARRRQLQLMGLLIATLPLLLDTPHGEGVGNVPPELAAQFVSASLVSAALFWIALGAVSGHLFQRWLTGEESEHAPLQTPSRSTL